MNVKSVLKGKHKRNVFEEPLTYLDTDVKIKFLYAFLEWLDQWKKCNLDSGMLSEETHTALYQTTYAMIELVRYCAENFDLKYILTGKFQTDSLENRFGQYRQLAGAQYNITLTQLLEVEKKLRVQSILPLNLVSNTQGKISVELNLDQEEEKPLDLSLPKNHIVLLLKKFNITFEDEDYASIIGIEEILAYIAGYCIHSCINRIKCDMCLQKLTSPKETTSGSLICELNRGGLKCPNDFVLDSISTCYIIVSKLLSAKFEAEFLKIDKKREIVYIITDHFLNSNEKSYDLEECQNGHGASLLQKYIIVSCINTLLKNYCKNVNNNLKDCKVKKRKLNTLKESKLQCEPVKKCKSNKKTKPVSAKTKSTKSKTNVNALNLCIKKKIKKREN